MLFDTHAHLNDEKFSGEAEEIIKRSFENRVSKILIAGADEESSKSALAMSLNHDGLYCSLGIHPHDAKSFNDNVLSDFKSLIIKHPQKVVAIGEIGLDYYYDFSPREIQKTAFRRQIEFAIEINLPIIVHDRDAHGDCLDIIGEFTNGGYFSKTPGVFHCFSGSYEMAEILLNKGFYLSFAGPVTFKNAKKTLEFLPKIPLDRILIETDCPYLAPEPNRGKRNEPSYVKFVAIKLAEIFNKSVEEIESITFKNACDVFRIKTP